MSVPEINYSCSFCGKPNHQVHVLIAGPGVSICNECIVLCVDVLGTRGQTIPLPIRPLPDKDAAA